MRKHYVSIIAAGLLTLGGIAAPARLATADSGMPSASAVIVPTIFRDGSGTPELAIQLQAGRPDTGQFDFYVADVGHYQGTIAVRPTGPTVDHLQGTVPVQFLADGGDQQTPTSVRFEGIVDPTGLSANVNVWIGGTHYHLQTDQGSATSAVPVVRQVVAALQAEDWATLYTLLASDVQSQYTQAQFVQMMSAESSAPGQPAITSVNASGSGQVVASPLGYTYYQQPLNVQARNGDGSTRAFTTMLYLLQENGTWRYWATDQPSDQPVGV